MSRQKKMNFSKILFNGKPLKEEREPTVHIAKNGQMTLSKFAVQKYGFVDCFIEIDRWDETERALGWRKIPSLQEKDWNKTTRLCKTTPAGTVKLSVGRILSALDLPKVNYKKLVIKDYEDTMEKQTIHYVVLPKSNPQVALQSNT